MEPPRRSQAEIMELRLRRMVAAGLARDVAALIVRLEAGQRPPAAENN